MIGALREVVQVPDLDAVDYLTPILTGQDWQSGVVVIASLNYDRTIEVLADKLGIPCDTGIEAWSRTGRLDKPTSGSSCSSWTARSTGSLNQSGRNRMHQLRRSWS